MTPQGPTKGVLEEDPKTAQNLSKIMPPTKGIHEPWMDARPVGRGSGSRPESAADQLGDSPFDRFHRRAALTFNIVVFWIIGRRSTASRNCLAIRRLLLFTADLIRSFMAQHTGTKGEVRSFGDMLNGFSDQQIIISPFFQLPLFLFAQLCPCLCLQV
uniref:Uncharacterized protein n=1 Tax=Solanum tuberosum TaxID=4113 RepID=M1DWV5_SOLTU